MHRRSAAVLCCIAALLVLSAGCREHIKEPAVAGTFYPAGQQELQQMVDGLLERAEVRPHSGRLIALIAPHAGYVYSGQVAAASYRYLKERGASTVILIGASHTVPFQGASVYYRGAMKTPLGNVQINEKIARSLLNEQTGVVFFPEAFAKEHSLEVQLPFLQRTLKDFTIVPILIGSPGNETIGHLRNAITGILKADPAAIVIASTDLSHYHDYDTASFKDRKMVDAIERMSIEDAGRCVFRGEAEMCGAYPVLVTMGVARDLGATNGIVYKYANSGDVTQDRSRVVGYAAIGLYRTPLNDAERSELLKLARETVAAYVKNRTVPEFKASTPRLNANGATFVTINRHGGLRGCIGNIQPVLPLFQSVIENAVSASSRDPRFPPMTEAELRDIEVEVTVLSPLEPLRDVSGIRIGTHGLYLVSGRNAGLLLPQVPGQFNWDVQTFLEQVSIKAGLPKDAWKTSQLYTFTADIIR
ncbi:MAG: AmmeMemoRadiSam system protein B [Thermodesulfovibrionales bacterium]